MVYDSNSITSLVSTQLPTFYNNEGSNLGPFIEKYYHFLETVALYYDDVFEYNVGDSLVGQISLAEVEILGFNRTSKVLFVRPKNAAHIILDEQVRNLTSLETTNIIKILYNPLRSVADFQGTGDVDLTSFDFLDHYKQEYIPGYPFDPDVNIRNLIKSAKKIYSAKGTENALKWLWRALYKDNDLTVSYPKDLMLRVSDGKWQVKKTLRLIATTVTNPDGFINHKIIGLDSGATAIVQDVQYISFGNSQDVELSISDIEGEFYYNEYVEAISLDSIKSRGIISAAISGIDIIDAGRDYVVGDEVKITGGGVEGQGQVSSVTAGVLANIIIIDGGDGYFVNDQLEFDNVGTGGSKAEGIVSSIVQKGSLKLSKAKIIDVADVTLDTINYGNVFADHDKNTHLFSDVTTTYLATVASTDGFLEGFYVRDASNTISATVVSVIDNTHFIYAIPEDQVYNFVPGHNTYGTLQGYTSNNVVADIATTTLISLENVEDETYYGALDFTYQPFGSIKEIRLNSGGENYFNTPTVRVVNERIIDLDLAPGVLGERSRFLFFDNDIEGIFASGDIIYGVTSGAKGTVLTPYISTGNGSKLRYFANELELALDGTDTEQANENGAILFEDGTKVLSEDVSFIGSEQVRRGFTSYEATLRNSAFDVEDTQTRGNNAVLEVGGIALGAIQKVTLTNFSSTGYLYGFPIVTVAGGDGTANLRPILGAVVEYPGSYLNADGLLSATHRIQDSYYYQIYSYVLKTQIPIKSFRDVVTDVVHPAGWALFGEISIINYVDGKLFRDKLQFKYGDQIASYRIDNVINYKLEMITLDAPDVHATMSGQHKIQISSMDIFPYSIDVKLQPRSEKEFLAKIQFPDFYPVGEVTIDVGPDTAADDTESYYNIIYTLQSAIQQLTVDRYLTVYEQIIKDISLTSSLLQSKLYNIIKEINTETLIHDTYNQSEIETSLVQHHPMEQDDVNTELLCQTSSTITQLVYKLYNIQSIENQRVLTTWSDYVFGQVYMDPGSNTMRSTPYINEYFENYNESSADQEVIQGYASLVLSETVIAPFNIRNINVYDEIALDNVEVVLENSDEAFLFEDGDNILMEDGYATSHINYDPAVSAFGYIVSETENYLEYENATFRANDYRVTLNNKYSNKYMVQSISDYEIQIYHTSEEYVPEGYHNNLVQHINIF